MIIATFNSLIKRQDQSVWDELYQSTLTGADPGGEFNRKIVEIGKFDIPNTHIHDRSLS
jgi:hypothetical protein